MSTDPATTAFAAFCKTGNPEQLGVVFDRLAPELLLVAARLLGPGGDPSDLVQQTFMTALQQRRKYEQGRPVAPWLVGILLQHVRRERRRLRRRIDSRRLREPATEDPSAVAATRDQAEAVRRGVTALPQPYRRVLQLHLIHGLPVNAVATSLELPFRTVQSQLRRGLHQLRKTLPRLAVAPWTGRSLDQVRADVLRAASSLFGWLLLPGLKIAVLLALAVPLCVLSAAAVAPRASIEAPTFTPGAMVAIDPASAMPGEAGPATSLVASVLERQLLQDPEPTCRVRLRLVRAEDQAPLAGAQVTAQVTDEDARGGLGAPRDVASVVSDEQGAAVIELPRASRRTAEIRIAADGRISVGQHLVVPNRDELVVDGLALWRAMPGRIRVRDQHGTPVPFLEVVVGGRSQHGFTQLEAIAARTGDDGWTALLQLPAGDTEATCLRVPIAFGKGDEVKLPLSVRGGDCELTLQRPDPKTTIQGQLVDQEGAPVAGGWLELLRARDGVALTNVAGGRLPTDAEGRFLLPVPEGEHGPFRIRGGIGQKGGQTSDATWESGATDALVRLRSPDGLALTVVDARTGEGIEDFGVMCLRVHSDKYGWITGDRELRCRGRHPGGVLFLEGVEAGDNRLLVLPAEDDPWLPSGYLPVRIAESGVTRLTVKLHRPAPVRVRLVSGDGKPLVGSRVRLRSKLSEHEYQSLRPIRSARFPSTHWQGRLDLAMAVTDSNGVAAVPWQSWRELVIVRADGPGHVVCERELPGVEPDGEPIELRVGRGAAIDGTVTAIGRWSELLVDHLGKPFAEPVDNGFDLLRLSVVLRNCADGSLLKDCEGRAFPIQTDGRFECRDVPPGRWQVLFQYLRPNSEPRIGTTTTLQHRSLVEVVTMPGKRHAATFDLAEVLPGSLRGRILVDGEVRAASRLSIGSHGRDHLGRPVGAIGLSARFFVRPDGSYEAGSVPGDIELEAYFDDQRYRLFDRIPLAPGEHKQVDLQFRHLVARIRLVTADGTPVGNRAVRAAGGNPVWVDEDGWFTLDPVLALDFEVELLRPGIDRSEIGRMPYNDPRLRSVTVGRIAVDRASARSEHVLTIRNP